MIESTVDLPQPECPKMHRNSPGRVTKLMSFTATYGPEGVGNNLVRPVTSKGVIMPAPPQSNPGEVPPCRQAAWCHSRSSSGRSPTETPQPSHECERPLGREEAERLFEALEALPRSACSASPAVPVSSVR